MGIDKYTTAGALGVALIGSVIAVVFPHWGIPILIVGVALLGYGVFGPRFDIRNRIRREVRAINDETRPRAVSYDVYYERVQGNREMIREIVDDEARKYQGLNRQRRR